MFLLTIRNRPNLVPSNAKPRLIKNIKYPAFPNYMNWSCVCYSKPDKYGVYHMVGRCGAGNTPREAYINWQNKNHRSIK